MGAWVRGDDVVAMTQFGEGTANQGEIHEAMNFAGVHRLPVIFICENNGYAISVPLDRQVAGGSVAARAAGYGMPGVVVDGGDVARLLRGGQGGPRPRPARRGTDADRGARRAPHVPLVRRRPAPLPRPRRGRGSSRSATRSRCSRPSCGRSASLDDEIDERMRAEVKAEVNEASARAEARPEPSADDAHERVYAEPIPGGGTATPLDADRRWGAATDGRAEHPRGDPLGHGRGDGARRARHGPGRGRRQEGRRLRRHRGPVGQVRRQAGARHAADRGDDRRRGDGRRGLRPAPDRRDAVRRLRLPRLQPDRLRDQPHPLPLERHVQRADGDPHAVRRRRPRGAVPQPVERGATSPRRSG